jgi:hypothetical protein
MSRRKSRCARVNTSFTGSPSPAPASFAATRDDANARETPALTAAGADLERFLAMRSASIVRVCVLE